MSCQRDIGKVKKVKIEHDNSGKSPGWFLRAIAVGKPHSAGASFCECSRWLATDEDDHQISRKLNCKYSMPEVSIQCTFNSFEISTQPDFALQVDNSYITTKLCYLVLTFRSHHEIFIRRSWYSVLPSLDATISCRIKKAVVTRDSTDNCLRLYS